MNLGFHRFTPLLRSFNTIGPLGSVIIRSTFRPSRLFIEQVRIKIKTEEDANKLIDALKPYERTHLLNTLQMRADVPKTVDIVSGNDLTLSPEQTKSLFLLNCLPFVGFGFLDNVVMIIAGEYIDVTLGVTFTISTMAAAGIGNLISDVSGVGFAHYVEYLVVRFGVKPPALTSEQAESGKARWITNLGRTVGLTVGCLIGMFPLVFFDEKEKLEIKRRELESQES